RPERARLPGHREAIKEDRRGVGEAQRGPHLVLLARDTTGYRSLCRLISRANLAGTKAMPRVDQALLAEHAEGLVALSGCRDGEIARRLRVGDRDGARAAARVLAERYGGPDGEGFHLELAHHRLAEGGGDVARAWAAGMERSVELAATCRVDLGFEQYRFPGFPVPRGETPFSYLSELCWEGAKKRYHPLTSAVVNRLAHELDVIERAGLAEFFLICWDLMRFAKEQGIPAQGRGSATSSIVSYTLGISRVEPIQHNLLFERFINEGRT